MLRFMEIIERVHGGPLCTEKEFDMKLFGPKLRAIIQEYDIRFDPEIVAPSDDAFADRLFEAGLEFYRQVGTYCVDTNRIFQFNATELREALATAQRGGFRLGSGRARRGRDLSHGGRLLRRSRRIGGGQRGGAT